MNSDYRRIAKVIRYLQDNSRRQPRLEELSGVCGLSPYHFQRLFRRWAGVSPKQFLQYLTVQHARHLLQSSAPVLDASFQVGLSSPGRLHDHFVQIEAVTPGDVKRCGKGLTLICGKSEGPFGMAFSAISERGICALEFLEHQSFDRAMERLSEKWPGAELRIDHGTISEHLSGLFTNSNQRPEVRLLARGTNFQVQVWQALLKIPPGHLCSYGKLAQYIGKPDATRAVASAVGANPVAFLIPCHRVLRASGALGGYMWGLERKQAMLAWESGQPAARPAYPAAAAAAS